MSKVLEKWLHIRFALFIFINHTFNNYSASFQTSLALLITLSVFLIVLFTKSKDLMQHVSMAVIQRTPIQNKYHTTIRVSKELLSTNVTDDETHGTVIVMNKTTILIPITDASQTPKLPQSNQPIQPHEPCKRLVTSRTTSEGRWYEYSRGGFVLYTYSALIDDRDSLESGPVVRIISIATNVAGLQNRPPMYCRFHFPVSNKTIEVHS